MVFFCSWTIYDSMLLSPHITHYLLHSILDVYQLVLKDMYLFHGWWDSLGPENILHLPEQADAESLLNCLSMQANIWKFTWHLEVREGDAI